MVLRLFFHERLKLFINIVRSDISQSKHKGWMGTLSFDGTWEQGDVCTHTSQQFLEGLLETQMKGCLIATHLLLSSQKLT